LADAVKHAAQRTTDDAAQRAQQECVRDWGLQMSTALYGFLGRFEPQVARDIGAHLGHRGEHHRTCSAGPDAHICVLGRAAYPDREAHDIPLAFSGRITNRRELAALAGVQEPASEETDRRILWALYRKLGPGAFALINGPYALALREPMSRTLVLAVDLWAAQPLHFARMDGGWIFASEYKALIGALMGAVGVDSRVARRLVAMKYLPLHHTLAPRIIALGPGEYVRLNAERCELASYRPLQLEIDPASSEQQCAAELRERILTAAQRLAEGRDALAVGLSSGLDSTLTLAALRKTAPRKRIYTYTASFDRNDPVLRIAAQTAQRFGAVHREIVVDPERLPSLLSQLVWRMEDPVARDEMLVYHLVAQHAAREAPLVLYGQMADLLFAGMPRHLLIKLASELPFAAPPLRQFYDYTQTGLQPVSWTGRLLVAAYFRGRRRSPPRVVGESHHDHPEALHLSRVEPLNAMLLRAVESPSEVGAVERLHAWAGVEAASIFHDRDVSQYAFRIPGKFKIHGRVRKHILRVASRGILPDELAHRPKDLIRTGRNVRVRMMIRRLSDALLSRDDVVRRGVFEPYDVEQLRRRIAGTQSTDQDFYYLWSILLMELWCRTFIDRRPQPYELHLRDGPQPVDIGTARLDARA
jgi:asparagine synthase (glutamine-hydrolysing)